MLRREGERRLCFTIVRHGGYGVVVRSREGACVLMENKHALPSQLVTCLMTKYRVKSAHL